MSANVKVAASSILVDMSKVKCMCDKQTLPFKSKISLPTLLCVKCVMK